MAQTELLHQFDCVECVKLNRLLARTILSLADSEYSKRSHYFAGRYENMYIPAERLPGMDEILDAALEQAGSLLSIDPASLHIGFWLNIMQQGQLTLKHSHDDDDELLSGTYYIAVPDQSSQLVLHFEKDHKCIEPREGMFVFFSPAIPHEVSINPAVQPRISIGFNIGLKPQAQIEL